MNQDHLQLFKGRLSELLGILWWFQRSRVPGAKAWGNKGGEMQTHFHWWLLRASQFAGVGINASIVNNTLQVEDTGVCALQYQHTYTS
jgi:hypothetical protein